MPAREKQQQNKQKVIKHRKHWTGICEGTLVGKKGTLATKIEPDNMNTKLRRLKLQESFTSIR